MRKILGFITVAIAVSGCAMGATTAQLRTRASFDLQCPAGAIDVVAIDDHTRGVQGCGTQATYVEVCRACANGYPACECTWVLNTDGRAIASR